MTRGCNNIATFYKSMVQLHLEYANVIWGPIFAKDKKDVESVQRRVANIIPEFKDKPYLERLQTLDIPT